MLTRKGKLEKEAAFKLKQKVHVMVDGKLQVKTLEEARAEATLIERAKKFIKGMRNGSKK